MNFVKYISLLDYKNNPVATLNYENFDESYIELIINTQCDLIELAFQISPIYGQMGKIGILDDYGIYGYMSMSENKIIMIIEEQEKRPKDILKQVYNVYKEYLLNPFSDTQSSQILVQKIDNSIKQYYQRDQE